MAVNLINGNDTQIVKTNDDIQVEFSQSRSQQIENIETDIENLQNINNYSTTEKAVGEWIDGSTIYRKVIEIPKSSMSGVTFNIAHGINNLDTIVMARGISVNTNDFNTVPWYSGGNYAIYLNDITSTNVYFNSTQNAYDKIIKIFLILEYTKSS